MTLAKYCKFWTLLSLEDQIQQCFHWKEEKRCIRFYKCSDRISNIWHSARCQMSRQTEANVFREIMSARWSREVKFKLSILGQIWYLLLLLCCKNCYYILLKKTPNSKYILSIYYFASKIAITYILLKPPLNKYVHVKLFSTLTIINLGNVCGLNSRTRNIHLTT